MPFAFMIASLGILPFSAVLLDFVWGEGVEDISESCTY